MSRVGYKPITIPPGVEVLIDGTKVTAKGPKGELCRSLAPGMGISLEDGVLVVSRRTDERTHRSMHGFTRSILANMIEGVSQGFRKNLEFHGVGYRVQQSGSSVVLQVGYSRPVEITPPAGIALVSEAPNQVSVLGIEKELVGEIAAKIRAVRPPDPYLGKGIRYAGEQIRRKAGKAGKLGRRK
jgi:large subunit ribosomal protein L6